MKTSRRQLIRMGLCATASLVACVDGFAGRAAFAAGPDSTFPIDDGLWLRRDLFETRVGEYVVVQTPRFGSVALHLARVEDCLSARNAGTVGSQDCFAVVFRGSRGTPLPQGTYVVGSMTMGSFLLFLVPGPAIGQSITYTATFNRAGGLDSTFEPSAPAASGGRSARRGPR